MTYEAGGTSDPQDPNVTSPEGQGSSAEEQLAAALQEIEQLKDRYLRKAAEMENYRKRVMREREQQQTRDKMELIRRLLPVADDFALAVSHVPAEYEDVPWIEGITLIHRKLETFLEGAGVEPIEATGQPFDPLYHDALMRESSDVYPEGTVTGEVRKGYMMGGEVLRPTLVKVSMGRSQ